jgi:protein transport protein SEC61 subunit gamma-like protein
MSFIDKVWQTQHKLEERFKRIGRGQYGRVLRLARKPTSDEFMKSSWVVAIGIGIIGAIGFIVYYVWLKGRPIVADLLGI